MHDVSIFKSDKAVKDAPLDWCAKGLGFVDGQKKSKNSDKNFLNRSKVVVKN